MNNSQSTHNPIVSRSVGIALLKLAGKGYFKGMPEEAVEEKVFGGLRAMGESKDSTIDFRPAIENIIRLAKEPPNGFDRVTLYLPHESDEKKKKDMLTRHLLSH